MGGSGDHCVKGNKPGSKRQISSFLLYAASIRVTDILLSIKYLYNFMHIICITKFIISIKITATQNNYSTKVSITKL